MFSMFVMTCIIWIEGRRYDGGEAKCGIHQPKLYFDTYKNCKENIKSYEEYVIKSIYDQFEPPQDIIINTMCYKENGENR